MKTTTTFNLLSQSRDLSYVRQVYLWLLVGLLIASGTAWASLNAGAMVQTKIEDNGPFVEAPPVVAWVGEHPWMAIILTLVLVALAAVYRKVRVYSGFFYVLFTSAMGVIAGPSLFVAQYRAAHHVTMSAHPIRDSFLLTLGAFLGLSAYAWTSKKDFSWMSGLLWAGLWVTMIATFLAIFIGSQPFVLAVDSAVILLFSGYILFDTQIILNRTGEKDAIGDALNLFLDVFNIFVRLLSISSSSED